MTQESKKFQTKVEFETSDQGGQWDPLVLPDLKPYQEANRDSLLRDFEQEKQLGLADLKLEQDQYKGVEAWNAQVWEYIAESGVDKVKHLSKALDKYSSGYAARKDRRDHENAVIEFQEAYENGDIAALQDVLKYNQLEDEAQKVDGKIETTAGRAHQDGTLNSDNIWRIRDLSPWRKGPHHQKLLLQHYASQIPAYLASTSNAPVYIAALGQSFSAAEPEKWPKGYAVSIQAAIDKQNIANLVGMFKGFNKVAVAKYITPKIKAYKDTNVINFADEQKTAIEGAVSTEIKNSLTPLYDGEPRELFNAVQEQFAHASKWMPPHQAKLAIFGQLKKDAKAGLLKADVAQDLLDTVMDPNSKSQQTYGEFLGERFLSKYDLVGEAQAHASAKERDRSGAQRALFGKLENQLIEASREYSEKNNGAIIPAENLREIALKFQNETKLDPWDTLTKIRNAENFDDKFVIARFERLRQVSGGKLTMEMLKGQSPGVIAHFEKNDNIVASSLVPNATMVTAGKNIVGGLVDDYLKSVAPGEPGGLKALTKEEAKVDYVTIYQQNLDGGMSQGLASKDAIAQVRVKIRDGDYKLPTEQVGLKPTAHNTKMSAEFAANDKDPSVIIPSLEADVNKMVKTWERGNGTFPLKYKLPDSIQSFANLAQISPQEAAFYQSGGKVKLPTVEMLINKRLGKNNLLTRNGTNPRVVRTSVDNEGIYIDLQKPEYQKGEYDAKDKNGVLTNIDIEKQTVSEVINLLESGELKTATGYEFTYQELVNAYLDSKLKPDSLMTPAIQKILYDHKQIPGDYPHVEPTGDSYFWNSNFLWSPT